MKKYTLVIAAIGLSLVMLGCSENTPTEPMVSGAEDDLSADKAGQAGTQRYEVIIENLTPATGDGASQPFSPPILATHKRNAQIFRAGQAAGSALEMVAEDAMSDALIESLHNSRRVHDVVMGGGVILPSGEMRLEIEASRPSKLLSLVFMLVNTNDAFGGLDSIRLPRHGEASFMVPAWDAGTEMNTELMSDIPGPCCGSPGMGTDEMGVVHHHPGIQGNGDLSAEMYGWEGAVATVTVRRMN